jgi:MFS family permease
MSSDGAVPSDPARREPARVQETAALKLALTGLAGASIEWYDFFLYATAAALVFPTLFFSATLPPFVALIASFSTFAVGFMARPAGAVLFGHMGDRVGRKTTLAVAMIVMGAATTFIGLLPSYRSAGFLSPLALVLLRITQGLAVGGQWGGAILLATESAPKSRRGLYGSIAQAGVPIGVVLANLAFLVANSATSPKVFIAYGWRIPFLFSIALVGLGVFVHFRIEDTAAFRHLQQSKPSPVDPPADGLTLDAPARGRASPVLEALRLYPRLILVAAGAFLSTNLTFYILITYAVAYGTSVAGLHLTRSTMLTAVLIANVTTMPVLFLAGGLSDRYGRRRIFMTGIALAGVWTFIFFPLIETRSLLWITVAIFVGLCVNALSYGPMAAMFAELFSTRVRYSAASLAYQIAAILGGGLAPIIATGLYARYHSNIWISGYMASACALSLVCASMIKETHGTDLHKYDEPAVALVVSSLTVTRVGR